MFTMPDYEGVCAAVLLAPCYLVSARGFFCAVVWQPGDDELVDGPVAQR